MNTSTRAVTRLCAVVGGIAIVSAATAFPAVAAGDDVQVINTETVQAYTDATGTVTSKKLYEQLALTGDGAVALANPVETSGLRNLDGFSGFDVEDGQQVVEIDVDGQENLRSVSSYDEELPLDISVEYVLDGEPISPKSLVGRSGDLEVTFTVRNATTQPQTITYTDGRGGTVEETAEVMMPMVGSLATTLPTSFRDIEAGGASAAGDGKGNTKLSYTMTLLAPLGSDVVELGYTAEVVDAVAPPASVTALPVNPLDNPTLSNAAKSYKGGADTGEKLAAGAATIDENLLKLRDGASDLLAGLIKLRNGADQLSEGLTNEAAPGARKLADGAGDLNDGLGKLDDGAGKLSAGTEDLRDGTGQLDDGAGKLDDGAGKLSAGTGELAAGAGRLDDGAGRLADGTRDLDSGARRLDDGAGRLAGGLGEAKAGANDLTAGLEQIAGGLDQLSGVEGLGKAAAGIDQLQAGVQLLLAGLGRADQPTTLIGGLTQLAQGLPAAEAGAGQILGGLNALAAGLPSAKGGVDAVKQGLDASLAENGNLDQLAGGLSALGALCQVIDAATPGLPLPGVPNAPAKQQCAGVVGQLQDGVAQSRNNLGQASAGLANVSAGLAGAIDGITGQGKLIDGATQLQTRLGGAASGAESLRKGAVDLKDGVLKVDAGLAQLEGGLASALSGVLALANGANAAYSGSQTLSGGLGLLSDGANELSAGTGDLVDGTGRLRDGAGRLSTGTGDLVDGAGRLRDGADKLAGGTGDLVDGVDRLDAGANKLADGAGELKGGTAKAEAGSLLIADGAETLADGLLEAAGGSGLLADGLATAAQGAPKLVDGAQRLSDEGTKKLVEAGEATAQDYGKQYSLIMAGAERAQADKMVVGAPDEAVGLAAYSFEIRGEDGEGSRNLTRALGGLGLLGAGAGLFALRRRFI